MRNAVCELGDAAATEALGAALGQQHEALICLSGPLGAGKTTLVRGLLRALGHTGAVRSPTYTLVESYLLAGREVQHLDLYRLEAPDELEDMGIRDYFARSALRLVEWPERAHGALGACDLHVSLELAGGARRARLEAPTHVGAELVAKLGDACDAPEGAV